MYNFIANLFHTIVEVSSIIFDLHLHFFADTKIFELESLCMLFVHTINV